MNRATEAPSGFAFEGRAAGRTGRVSRDFPRGDYHGKGRGASRSGRFMVALTPQGAKTSGVIVERAGVRVWVRRVDSARHLLRLPEPSWAFDVDKVAEAQAAGVTRVEVVDEGGRVWWTPLAHLIDRGIPFDRGHGPQVRLPLDSWSFVPAVTLAHLQAGLFGGSA